MEALPHLRGGLRRESADYAARVLHERLNLDAAAVVSRDEILAFVGLGADHHLAGSRSLTTLTERALRSGEVVRTADRDAIGCSRPDCPLSSALVVPLSVAGEVVGALKFYHGPGRMVIERDENIARGLGRIFSVYLELANLDARAALVTRAELMALRAQISPHFLFNTLTTIAALTRTDADRAHDLLIDFADFFRESLTQRRELVPLRDELGYVERYARFEKARFGDRLSIEYDIDPRALEAATPMFSVQPLVENAIGHGIAPKEGAGSVHVSARTTDDGFEVGVHDNGVGMSRTQRGQLLSGATVSGCGVALTNIHQRLRGYFGAASGLRIESRKNVGTSVRFWIPADSAGDAVR